MCKRCADPEMTAEQYLTHLTDLIRRHGWAVQGIERERHRPPWAYTVGLTACGMSELLVTGMPLPRAAALLNAVAAHAVHAEPPTSGEQVALVGGPVVEFVGIAHPEVHLLRGVDLYGPVVRGMQVVWADDRGRWPWDVGFRSSRGGQPVLGPRTADR
jgi:Domain of unknown function (DUF4262)